MTNDRAHLTITLPDGATVRAYMAYRPCEGPDGSDWAARFDLTDPARADGQPTHYGWKADHAAAFIMEHSPTAVLAYQAVDALADASRALMRAESLAR